MTYFKYEEHFFNAKKFKYRNRGNNLHSVLTCMKS